MSKKKATYAEDLQLDYTALANWEDGKCWLVSLDDWQISVIQSCLRYAEWSARWVNVADWPTLYDKIQELEACLLMGCDMQELNGYLERIAIAFESTRDLLGPSEPEHTFYAFLQELEALGTNANSGDPIMVSLQKIVGGMATTDMTLQELIDEIEDANDPKFKDFLEMLNYIKLLLPTLPDVSLNFILKLISWLYQARYMHTTMTLQAFQATNLRGIQNALTAFKEGEDFGDTEEGIVKQAIKELENIPWLANVLVAVVDPSPTGEVALAGKIALTAKGIFDKIQSLWEAFRNAYINQVEDPIPTSTVTGQLAEIAARLQNLDTGSTSSSLFDAINAMANGLAEIDQTLEEDMSINQNVTVNCGSSCGGSLGGGMCIIADESGAGSSIDQPEYTLPDAEGGENPPPGFDDWGGEDGYYEYKCKAANVMLLGFCESLYQLMNIQYNDTSQYVVYGSIFNWVFKVFENYAAWANNRGAAAGEWAYTAALPYLSYLFSPELIANVRQWTAGKVSDAIYAVNNGGDNPISAMGEFQIFGDLRLSFLADRETIVCELYNSTTTAEAKQVFTDYVDTYLASYSYDQSAEGWAAEIIEGNLNNAWLNLLFQQNEYINEYTDSTAISCALCAGHWSECYSEGFTDEDSPLEIVAVQGCGNSYNCYGALIYFDFDGVAFQPGARQFTVNVSLVSGTIADCPGKPGSNIYYYYDTNFDPLLESPTQDTEQPCNGMLVLSSSPFTVTFAFTPEEE